MREIDFNIIQRKLATLNPHWHVENAADIALSPYPKKRQYFWLFFDLVSQLSVKRAVILMGSRRVGKTVFLLQAIEEFIKRNFCSQDLVYIPLDNPIFHRTSLEELIACYLASIEQTSLNGKVIFFDEIQYLKDWDNQLKVLVDQYPDTKFVASGSAASVLKRKSTESGAGRFSDFILPPVTFYEYLELLNLVDDFIIFDEKKEKGKEVKNIEALNQEFINYINYGGFPEAIFNQAIRDNSRQFIQQDIVDKVLLRDLPSLYGINDIQELNRLFHHLCYQTGQEISYEHIKSYSGFSPNSIKKYLEYLEAAFLVKRIYRIDETAKTLKTVKNFKIYLTNTSLYAALFGSVTEEDVDILGALVETAIYSQYIHDENWLRYLHYAKFKKQLKNSDKEIDMVHLDKLFRPDWCLEIKWRDKHFTDLSELAGLIKFIELNKPIKTGSATTRTILGEKSKNDVRIYFKPAALVCFNIGYTLIKNRYSSP